MSSDPSAKGTRRPIRLGKYEVIRHIATGGMGAVYHARDTKLGREVALKVLPPEMATNEAARKRFLQEASHAAKLRHENIVTLYENGEYGDTFYIAMEFIEGIDLHEYISRKVRLDPEEARQIVIQAAKALNHAFKQGIIHRDIKPSNFLIVGQNEQLVVKMTDLGLARMVNDNEESRVTRSGTTVGTVDYMSPEQARDSRKADIRSDIYSLGCTLYHMLAGQAPFPEGGLTERLYKHVEAEPPDVRQFNPKVPDALRMVLGRMLEKKPEDRYQTPADLLKDLINLNRLTVPEAQRDVLAGLALAVDEKPVSRKASDPVSRRRPEAPPGPRAPVRRRPIPPKPETVARKDAETEEIVSRPQALPWMLVAGAGVLIGIVVVAVLALRSGQKPAPRDPGGQEAQAPPPQQSSRPEPTKHVDLNPILMPKAAGPLWLYPAAATVRPAEVWDRLQAPWIKDLPPLADAPVFKVKRLPTPGDDHQFDSLAAACARAEAGRVTVIEIDDNGPIFEAPVAVSGRSLIVRAAANRRPLLVWDRGAAKPVAPAKSVALLSLAQGSLTLENLDIVLKWTETSIIDPVALVHVMDGDFLARRCIFSVAGNHPAGLAIARLDGTKSGSKARLSQCYGRGASLVALDVLGPAAEVLVDGSLLVGGERPLLQVATRDSQAATVRLARSTLVAAQTLLQVRPASPVETNPAFHWIGWDSLLTRSSPQTGGDLLDARECPQTNGFRWHADNCLYAGWRTLLAGRDTIAWTETDLSAWHGRWRQAGGDKAVFHPWPPVSPHNLAEIASDTYRIKETDKEVSFPATADPRTPLGCDLMSLPRSRDNWLVLTYDRFVTGPVTEAQPSEVPPPVAGLYQGERIDLAQTDLGGRLQEVQKTLPLAPRVVMRLYSSADAQKTRPTSPVHVQGCTLVLSFEPSAKTPAVPVVLMPDDKIPSRHEGLIEVDNGNLEVIGGEIRFPNYHLAMLPPYLLRVRGGDLRLHGCRLTGPLGKAPPFYRGLVRLDGAEQEEIIRGCAITECVLISGRTGVQCMGTGIRLRVQQSLVLAGTDAFTFDPGPAARARLNVQCLLEYNTLAAKEAVLRVADVPHLAAVAEPLVIQTRANVFLNPFAEPAPRSGLLLYDGEAISRGLLLWQGEENVYDVRRLAYYVSPVPPGDGRQPQATVARVWGTLGDRKAILDRVPLVLRTFDLDKLDPVKGLEPLLPALKLPTPPGSKERPPGADLAHLGVQKAKPPR